MPLADGVTALATKIGNYLRDSVVPRLLPRGGVAGQPLVKATANDYSMGWASMIPVQYGGTGAATQSQALANLGGAPINGSVNFAGVTVGSQAVWHAGNLTLGNLFDKSTTTVQHVACIPSFNNSGFDVVRPNVLRLRVFVGTGGRFNMQNGDTGDQFFSVGTDGSFTTKQLGDLNTYIRACVNKKTCRLAYAGDLDNRWQAGAQGLDEPYFGSVMTTRRSDVTPYGNQSQAFRWRYLQMTDVDGNWYTCGYA